MYICKYKKRKQSNIILVELLKNYEFDKHDPKYITILEIEKKLSVVLIDITQ